MLTKETAIPRKRIVSPPACVTNRIRQRKRVYEWPPYAIPNAPPLRSDWFPKARAPTELQRGAPNDLDRERRHGPKRKRRWETEEGTTAFHTETPNGGAPDGRRRKKKLEL